ncbi:hypothetical protein BC828DRAFT_221963 [Blastocladiella britannica]|nr:hypothetical protein BC828DRAFT_221963 [Blastocladiella britannica]
MQLCHFASLSNYFSGVSVCPQPLLDKCLLSSWGQSLLVFHLKGDTSPQSEFISVSAGIGGGGLADRVPKSLISIKRVALDSGDVSAAQSPEVQRRFTSISGSMAPSESLQGLLTSIVHKWCAGSAPTGFPNLVRATAHALHSERRRHLVPCPWHLGQCLQVLDRDPLLTGMRLITDVATVNIKVLAERLSWMFNWLPEFPDLPYPDIGPTMTPTAAVLPTSPDHTLLFATSTAPTDSATPLSTETYRLAVVETLLYMMLAFRHEGRNGSNPSHFEYSFRNVKSDGSTADFSSHSVPNVPDPQSSHAELFPVTTLAHMRAIVHGWLCRLVHLQHRFPWMRDTLVPSGTVLSSLGFLDVDAVMRIVDWLWSYQYVGLTPEVNPFLLPSSDGDTLTPPEPGSSDASRASTTFNVPILETMEELYFQPRKVIRSAPILGALFSVTPITRPIAPDSRRQSESGSEADGVSNGGGDSPATLDGESDKEDLNSAPNLDTAGSRRVARRVSFGTSSKALSHWVLVVCLLIVPILVLAASLFLAPIDATPPQMPHIKLPPAENVVPDEAEHVSQVSPAVLAAVNEDNYICRLLCPSHLGMHRLLPPVRKRLHPQHDQRPPPTPPPQLQQQPGTKKPPIVIPASSSPGKHTFSVRSTMDDVAAAAAGKKRDKRGLLEAANPVGRAPWVRLGPGGGRGSLSIGSVARLWVAEVWWIVSTQSLLATPDPGTMLPPPTQTEK